MALWRYPGAQREQHDSKCLQFPLWHSSSPIHSSPLHPLPPQAAGDEAASEAFPPTITARDKRHTRVLTLNTSVVCVPGLSRRRGRRWGAQRTLFWWSLPLQAVALLPQSLPISEQRAVGCSGTQKALLRH